jgi:hypothetical protein
MEKAYNVKLHLFYGKELFDFLEKTGIWNEISDYLAKWKGSSPDLPELNFDLHVEETFNEK